MSSRIVTDPFYVDEKRTVPFDFAAQVGAGETISSATAVSSVYSGTDSTPDIVNGAASVSGTVVSVTLGGGAFKGTVGVIYQLLVEATKSTGEIIDMSTYIAFVPALP